MQKWSQTIKTELNTQPLSSHKHYIPLKNQEHSENHELPPNNQNKLPETKQTVVAKGEKSIGGFEAPALWEFQKLKNKKRKAKKTSH